MALEDKGAQHQSVVDKVVEPIIDYYMKPWDYVVRPSSNIAIGNYTLYLPPVSLAKGRFYSIVARIIGGGAEVTVTDLDDSESWTGDITLNGKGDKVLAYSDGSTWHVNSYTDAAANTTLAATTLASTSLAPTT